MLGVEMSVGTQFTVCKKEHNMCHSIILSYARTNIH